MRPFRVLLLWVAASFYSAHAETVQIFSGDAFAPLIYLKEGKATGLLPRILERVSKISGDTYELHLYPWKRAYLYAEKGDGGILGLSYTADRAKVFDYSTAIYDNDIFVVTTKKYAFDFKSLKDLSGKTVGAFSGESFGEEIDQAIAKRLFVIEGDSSNESRIQKLLAGRIQVAFLSGGQLGLKEIYRHNRTIADQRERLVVLSKPLVHDPLHLAFAKSSAKGAVIARFDKAMGTLKRSGALRQLMLDTVDSD